MKFNNRLVVPSSDELRRKILDEAQEQVSIIQSHLKAAQSRQKTYADKRRRPLQFEVGDHVYLKVSLMRGVHRFGAMGR